MRQALVVIMSLLWPATLFAEPDETFFLRIYTEEYAPWNYSHSGEVTGLNTELIQQMLDRLNYRGRFEIIPWGRAQLFTQTQSNACFFSAVRTIEREEVYQWVGPLSKEYVQLFSTDPDHPKFNHLAEAATLRIGGQTADAFTDYGVEQGLNIERIAEIPVNLDMLQLKRIDLWLAGSIGGPYIASRKGLRIYPVATSEVAFELWLACNPNLPDKVIEKLNITLNTMKQDGSVDIIMQRYR